jgi:hypothetical protein
MQGVLAGDQAQLDRIDRTIAAIEARPPAEQARMARLLAALQTERAHILHSRRPALETKHVVRRAPPRRPAAQ